MTKPPPEMVPIPPLPLEQDEYEDIYAKVPRLTVEVVVTSSDGILLVRRDTGPCQGLWHIPGGTVRFGEPLTDAVRRVADHEVRLEVIPDDLLGYIEYPSHLERALDWPVGIAFRCHLTTPWTSRSLPRPDVGWFAQLPDDMHDEQRCFLRSHGLAS